MTQHKLDSTGDGIKRGSEAVIPTPLHPSIPRVSCPRCCTTMRLAEILTGITGEGFIYFDCACGFEYRMAAKGAKQPENPVP